MEPHEPNVLYLPEVIGTMSNNDREEYSMLSYISRIGLLTISDLNKNTPTYYVKIYAPSVQEIYLNFGTGVVGSMI